MESQPFLCLLLGQLVSLLILLEDSTNTGKVIASYSRRQERRHYLTFDLDSGVAFMTAVRLLVTCDNWHMTSKSRQLHPRGCATGIKRRRRWKGVPKNRKKFLRVTGLPPHISLDIDAWRKQTSEQKAWFLISLVIKLAIGKALSRRDSSEQVPPLDCTMTSMTHRLPTFDIPSCWPWLRPRCMNWWWQVSSAKCTAWRL